MVIAGSNVREYPDRVFITRKNRKCEAILDAQFKRIGKSLTWLTGGKKLEATAKVTPNIVESDDDEETKVVPLDTSSDTLSQ